MLVKHFIQIIILVVIIVILGNLNFSHTTRTRLFMLLSLLFNMFMGFSSSIVCSVLKMCFTKDISGAYFVATLSESTNYFIGLVFFIIYFFCLAIMNIYICGTIKFNKKIYFEVNIIALIAGIIINLLVN